MIIVIENAEYKTGFEMAKISGQLHSVVNELDNVEKIDLEFIRTTIEDILDDLRRMHDMMSDG